MPSFVDVCFAKDELAIFKVGDKICLVHGDWENVAGDISDLARLFDGKVFPSGYFSKSGQEKVAERMAFKFVSPLESKTEAFFESLLGEGQVGEGKKGTSDVSWGKHTELFPESAG